MSDDDRDHELDRAMSDAIAEALPEKWREDWVCFGDPRPVVDAFLARLRAPGGQK